MYRLELIIGTGNLLDSMLHDAIFYRQSKSTLYQSCSPAATSDSAHPEFLPWTASDSHRGARNCLMEQVCCVFVDREGFKTNVIFYSLSLSLSHPCSYK